MAVANNGNQLSGAYGQQQTSAQPLSPQLHSLPSSLSPMGVATGGLMSQMQGMPASPVSQQPTQQASFGTPSPTGSLAAANPSQSISGGIQPASNASSSSSAGSGNNLLASAPGLASGLTSTQQAVNSFLNPLVGANSNFLNSYDQSQNQLYNQQFYDPQGVQQQLADSVAQQGLGESPIGTNLENLGANRYWSAANAQIGQQNQQLWNQMLGGGFLGSLLNNPYTQESAQQLATLFNEAQAPALATEQSILGAAGTNTQANLYNLIAQLAKGYASPGASNNTGVGAITGSGQISGSVPGTVGSQAAPGYYSSLAQAAQSGNNQIGGQISNADPSQLQGAPNDITTFGPSSVTDPSYGMNNISASLGTSPDSVSGYDYEDSGGGYGD